MTDRIVEHAKADPRFNKYVDETDREWLRRTLREVHGIATDGTETTDVLFHLSPTHVCFEAFCPATATCDECGHLGRLHTNAHDAPIEERAAAFARATCWSESECSACRS